MVFLMRSIEHHFWMKSTANLFYFHDYTYSQILCFALLIHKYVHIAVVNSHAASKCRDPLMVEP